MDAIRIPPNSVEAESSVLGGLLLDNRVWDLVNDLLHERDFHRFEHRMVFGAIGALIHASKPADVITVNEQLQSSGKAEEAGGLDYLNALAQYVPSAHNIRSYAEIVHGHSRHRQEITKCEAALAAAIATPPAVVVEPQSSGLVYVMANELPDEFTPPDELVQGLLTVGDGSVLYGDSNSGKTFLVIDLACAVARGVPWIGRQTEPGLVLYLAAESPSSVRARLQAYQAHHGVTVPNFAIVQSPIDLFDGDADTNEIIKLVRSIEARFGQRVRLIIGDTLARLSAGANENAGQDMGLVVRRFDRIRAECKAHFLLIHHCGKAATAGARGWSGVRAAVDTEIEVTETPSGRCAEITKQRDLATKGERIGFRLQPVALGMSKWQTPATSCVVVSAAAPAKPVKTLRLGETQQSIMALLRGAGRNMPIAEIAEQLANQEIKKTSVYNAVNRLRDVELVEISMGLVHLIGRKS